MSDWSKGKKKRVCILSLEPSIQRATTLFLTWVFYAPAITLLALSGYRWAERRAVSNA